VEQVEQNVKTQAQDVSHPMTIPSLATIPAGDFQMGCWQGRDDEKPVHRVWVDKFALAAYAVTNEEYLQFVEETGIKRPSTCSDEHFCHPRRPVVGVSWYEAMAYCDWLSLKMGAVFRLPTEAEWERAVRGHKEGTLYSWGDQDPSHLEVYRTGWRDGRPQFVGLREPNDFGVYDLGDNIHEWCLDWYQADYYQISPYRNPVNMQPSARRASRGGSWRHQIKVSRCAARSSLDPSFKYTDYGFRVARVSTPINEGRAIE